MMDSPPHTHLRCEQSAKVSLDRRYHCGGDCVSHSVRQPKGAEGNLHPLTERVCIGPDRVPYTTMKEPQSSHKHNRELNLSDNVGVSGRRLLPQT